jgi:hypothetical protein
MLVIKIFYSAVFQDFEVPETFFITLLPDRQYVRYNTALRRWPLEEYNLMVKAGNLYTTTISVLVSAVQKIARTIKLPEGLRLFRGLGGLVDLPNEFFFADAQGRKGFVEWGFMSTTSDETVRVGCENERAGERRGLKTWNTQLNELMLRY